MGIRGVRGAPRLVRGWCAPGHLPPGPGAAAALALHGTQGLAGGPAKPVQLAATPQALVARQGLPAFSPLAPRPCALPRRQPFSLRSARPDKLVSLLQGGASRLPLAAAVAARRLGTRLELGPGAVPPSALPRSLPRVERGRAARPGAVVRRPAPVPRSRAPEAGGQP